MKKQQENAKICKQMKTKMKSFIMKKEMYKRIKRQNTNSGDKNQVRKEI